jgi:hypothetical protein
LVRRPIFGNENLVSVSRAVDCQRAVQKSGVMLGERTVRCRQKHDRERYEFCKKIPHDSSPPLQFYHANFDAWMGRMERMT